MNDDLYSDNTPDRNGETFMDYVQRGDAKGHNSNLRASLEAGGKGYRVKLNNNVDLCDQGRSMAAFNLHGMDLTMICCTTADFQILDELGAQVPAMALVLS